MTDYIKPSIPRKPNEIIVHVETNNIKSEEPRTVVEKIVKLCSQISTKRMAQDEGNNFFYYRLDRMIL